jgi:hypothetical protein
MRSWEYFHNLIPNPSPQVEKGVKKPIAYNKIPFTKVDGIFVCNNDQRK